MARKMFGKPSIPMTQGDQKSAVTWNKIGIAWHSLANMNGAQEL